jgi:hypothetical protein
MGIILSENASIATLSEHWKAHKDPHDITQQNETYLLIDGGGFQHILGAKWDTEEQAKLDHLSPWIKVVDALYDREEGIRLHLWPGEEMIKILLRRFHVVARRLRVSDFNR